MVKYDEVFKQKVVHAYLAGEGGYSALATRFGVPSKTNIRKWVSAFRELGKQGLVTVLNYKLRTRDSCDSLVQLSGHIINNIFLGVASEKIQISPTRPASIKANASTISAICIKSCINKIPREKTRTFIRLCLSGVFPNSYLGSLIEFILYVYTKMKFLLNHIYKSISINTLFGSSV